MSQNHLFNKLQNMWNLKKVRSRNVLSSYVFQCVLIFKSFPIPLKSVEYYIFWESWACGVQLFSMVLEISSWWKISTTTVVVIRNNFIQDLFVVIYAKLPLYLFRAYSGGKCWFIISYNHYLCQMTSINSPASQFCTVCYSNLIGNMYADSLHIEICKQLDVSIEISISGVWFIWPYDLTNCLERWTLAWTRIGRHMFW